MARKTTSQASTPGAKKRVTTTREEEIVPPDNSQREEAEFEEEPPSDLELLVGELGGDSYEFAVFRLDPKAARGRTFVGPLPGQRDTFAVLQLLQETYGGGTFELRVREPGGTFSHRVTVAVEAPKKVEPPVAPAQQMQEQMSAVLRTAMEPMQQVIAELRARPQFKFEDLLTKGAMLLPLLQQVRAILQPVAPAGSATDPFAVLNQMKQMKETMDALGLSDREPDGVDRMLSLFNTFKPMLEKAVTLQATRAAHPPRPAAPAPTLAGASPVATVPVAPAPTFAAIPDSLQPYIPTLVLMAQRGETPESVAALILNTIPDNAIDPLADALEDGSLVSALLQRPEFRGQEPWLNALAKNILMDLESGEESVEGDDVPVPSGDESGTSGETDSNT